MDLAEGPLQPDQGQLVRQPVQRKQRRLAEDPIQRYEKLLARVAPVSHELEPAALQPVIEKAATEHHDEVSVLSEQVAEHSQLTVAQAKPVVAKALEGQTDPAAKAAAVSTAVKSATGASATVELSDPVMLIPFARASFAALLFGAVIICITKLGESSGTPGSALVGLAVVGVLSLVGILVLVMGYKNVTIKGSPPASG